MGRGRGEKKLRDRGNDDRSTLMSRNSIKNLCDPPNGLQPCVDVERVHGSGLFLRPRIARLRDSLGALLSDVAQIPGGWR